ncbi:serine/threonine-protein kinase [Ferrimonas balearica]|uniref:serine/threonine-protein kinase n=1 Tax=Ferrimonas balearica TaxID=44012 RepID=UPI001F319053|nr:serine/threonine-protein kinase [Ferrimonas balearica]MBY6095209.1 protein kinase [Ferrimonas balearica]
MSKPDDIRIMFERAMNLPEPMRAEWMATLDQVTREELTELLDHADAGRHYFKSLTGFLYGSDADSLEDPLELLGKEIGGYTVTELLGQGGMGVVYKGYDPKLERSVAIKLLAPGQHLSDVARSRFLSEAQLVSRLDHTHIGILYGHALTQEGLDAMIMAFYDGQTLDKVIQDASLTAEQLVAICRDVIEGLSYAHEQGVIHKDIKPANLMLLGNGQIKILDFGAAAYLEQEQEDTSVPIGTTAYMSPEQIRAEPLTPATDFWSLGVVLFEAAIANGWIERVNAFTWAQNPAASSLRAPEEVERLLLAMLRVDPEQRAQAVQQLAEPTVPSVNQVKLGFTRKGWLGVAVATLLSVAGAYAWYAMTPTALQLPEHRKLALHFDHAQPIEAGLASELSDRLTALAYEQGNVSYLGSFDGEGGADGMNPDGIDPASANLTWLLDLTDSEQDATLGKDQVRLSLVLTETSTGDVLVNWQQTYPRARLDLIPADLYQQVLAALAIEPEGLAQLTAQESITNPEAYAQYLEARAILEDYQSDMDVSRVERLDEAFTLAREANRISPQASYQLLLAWLRMEQYTVSDESEILNDAIYWANQALATNGNLIDAYLVLGRLYGEKDQYGSAIASYQLALQHQPKNLDAYEGLARVYIGMGRFDEAESTLQQALVLDPNHWKTHSALGVTDHYAQRYQQAAVHYKDALALAPGNRAIRSNLAVLLVDQQDYSGVLAAYEGVADAQLDGFERLNVAVAHFYLQDFHQAVRYYQLALEQFPNMHGLWAQLGLSQVLAEGEESPAAQASFEHSLTLAEIKLSDNPYSISMLANIANCRSWLGQHQSAVESLNEALALWRSQSNESGSRVTRQVVSTGMLVLERSGQRDAALALFQEGQERGFDANALMDIPYLSELKADSRFQAILNL